MATKFTPVRVTDLKRGDRIWDADQFFIVGYNGRQHPLESDQIVTQVEAREGFWDSRHVEYTLRTATFEGASRLISRIDTENDIFIKMEEV